MNDDITTTNTLDLMKKVPEPFKYEMSKAPEPIRSSNFYILES